MSSQPVGKTDGRPKTVRELLSDAKYAIDYYQREYKWESKHIITLLDDLEQKFMSAYEPRHGRVDVKSYPHYFLGSVIVGQRERQSFIIDGQQRLTTLTLLLVYLNNLQRSRAEKVDIDRLVFSERYGQKSFNIQVEERVQCMTALYQGQPFDPVDQSQSIRNIVDRYSDIEEMFPEPLKGEALPYFIDWLLDNVDLIEIVPYSYDDSYTIFETMNDRGLVLSPTDMLKGYLLANIKDLQHREAANELWKERTLELLGLSKDDEPDFFKAWLRAKYAETIRERQKGATNKDFEKIGTAFHHWVREEREGRRKIGLLEERDFYDFVSNQFDKFSKQYLRLRRASSRFTPGLEYVYYNDQNDFTLQYPLLLAPLRAEDDQSTVDTKIRLVSGYIDIFVIRRIVNLRTRSYSAISYTMFNLLKEIRNLGVEDLAAVLKENVSRLEEKLDGVSGFYLHQQNRRSVHHLLARITYHMERQCGVESNFETYVSREIKKPFEIEHLWAEDKYSQYSGEFPTENEYLEYRNHIGGLILIPRGFNQSFNADTYEKKVNAYFGQNLLAKSLNPLCYENNPAFQSYMSRSGLPFKPYPTHFRRSDLDERTELYRRLCEEIWSPNRFDRELEEYSRQTP
jgi:uncharacterized protein with ParB-like and HNH nuclease domain